MQERVNMVDLEKIAGGAAAEIFREELRRVIQNVNDPNTDWKKPRKTTITFGYYPTSEQRNAVSMTIQGDSKLCPLNPVMTLLSVGVESVNGRIVPVAAEVFTGTNPKQQAMFKTQGKQIMPEEDD